MEEVKAMIHDKHLPMHLWAEETRTVVYVEKISPHRALGKKTSEEMFKGEKPKVNHLWIFGCPMYVHVPKDKRSKLDPSGKKGVFFGYSETSKAYRVYIPGYRQIDINRDITFDEDATFNRSMQHLTNEIHDEELVAPRVVDSYVGNDVVADEHGPEDHDMEKPQRPVDSNKNKRRPAWVRQIIQDVEKYGAPDGYLRESKKPRPYSIYVALLCDSLDVEPTYYEEDAKNKVWNDAMIEEYHSIIKNDVWDVVLRPKEK
jgi:hypothetical protein